LRPPNQLSFETIPNDQASFELVQSKAWQEMVAIGGGICQVLGLPRSIGQIFGLLYLSTEPLSLNKMSEILGISKGSASVGTRQLVSWGAIRKVWIPGNRRDYYEVVEDLGQLVRGSYSNLLKPRIQSSKDRLAVLKVNLKEDIQSGAIPIEKKQVIEERIKSLEKVHKRLFQFLPLAEKFIN
jgi:DNA-binding transcriptional regulator GbsR (MarR family)